MLRLCSDSSRSYPGRPARFAALWGAAPVMATYRETVQESAEAIVGARKQAWQSRERLTPPKGRTQRREDPL